MLGPSSIKSGMMSHVYSVPGVQEIFVLPIAYPKGCIPVMEILRRIII